MKVLGGAVKKFNSIYKMLFSSSTIVSSSAIVLTPDPNDFQSQKPKHWGKAIYGNYFLLLCNFLLVVQIFNSSDVLVPDQLYVPVYRSALKRPWDRFRICGALNIFPEFYYLLSGHTYSPGVNIMLFHRLLYPPRLCFSPPDMRNLVYYSMPRTRLLILFLAISFSSVVGRS